MIVREIMTTEVSFVTADTTIEDAIGLMRKQKVQTMPVVGADRRFLGMFTVRLFLKKGLPVHCEWRFAGCSICSRPAEIPRDLGSHEDGGGFDGHGCEPSHRGCGKFCSGMCRVVGQPEAAYPKYPCGRCSKPFDWHRYRMGYHQGNLSISGFRLAMKTRTEVSETYQLETENRQLKETIVALRTEFEALRFQQDAKVQEAVAAANDEGGQLKETIVMLRDTLEHHKAMSEDHIQNLERSYRDERMQLQETIRVLRVQLEARHEA